VLKCSVPHQENLLLLFPNLGGKEEK